ncbi:MAG TPA: electron transport complex subunit RsxC [Bacillota bacterium]|nr:electron transport complex subunit RsxC [Bacillota bacterium]HPE38504.1 electron transport complex subunit RsxC [Bacillota bacterium]
MRSLHAFTGGVHPIGNKNTDVLPSIHLHGFKEVELLLKQHIGPPCTCVVKPGDKVYVGTMIGRAEHPMAVPIHSSVSGTVKEIHYVISANGTPVESVRIESDLREQVDPACCPPLLENKDDFLKMIRDSGLVGLGGAAFPTHIKLNPPADKPPKVLIVNAAECEPYITADYRQICEHPDDIVDGILAVMKYLSIPKTIVGVEDNKPLVTRIFTHELKKHFFKTGTPADIEVKTLKSIYPQGAEKMLIYTLIGKKVPPGKLPLDVGVVVMNVSTLRFIGLYLKEGVPLTRKRVTLDGSALNTPGNFIIPIGAKINDIIEAAGGTSEEPKKIIMGGAMMGVAVDRDDIGIVKPNNAILVFGSKETTLPPESACIRCGRCVASCPMHLMPTGIDQSTRRRDVEGLIKYHVMDCIECGCCTYACPAKRYLTQSIKDGKSLVRKENERIATEKKLLAEKKTEEEGK